MISPYQSMGPAPGLASPMPPLPLPPAQQPGQPMGFTRTVGEAPFKQLEQKQEMVGTEISDLTLQQALLKHQKDQLTREKNVYQQIMDRIKGSI